MYCAICTDSYNFVKVGNKLTPRIDQKWELHREMSIDQKGLQNKLDVLNKYSKDCSLEINASKTKVIFNKSDHLY